jgi:putative MATE family efflux protein
MSAIENAASPTDGNDHPPAAPVRDRRRITTGPIRKTLLLLALPVLAEQMLNTMVALFDVYLAGQISPAATSAIGLAAYVDWLVAMMVMLVATGTTALVARHEGAADRNGANHFANQSLTLSAIVGVVAMASVVLLAPSFATYCRMTGESYNITVSYLRIGSIGHAAMSIALVGSAAIRGVGNMRTPMAVFAIINVINMIASVALVYGLGGLPACGVTGIVLGTVIARIVGLALIATVFLWGRTGLRLAPAMLPLAWASVVRILRIGVPAAADGAIMWCGHFVFLAIISRLAPNPLGEAYFAAHVIAVRAEAFTYLPAMAWAAATATMIGQSLGDHRPDRARRAGHEAVRQCGILAVVMAIVFLACSELIYRVMSADELVRSVGAGPFRILAVFQPLLAVSIVYVGGLRGAGDTRSPLLITFVGTILIRVPLGYYFGVVRGGGLLGAWIGMFGDMIWRAVAASVRYGRGRWIDTKI